MLLPIGKPGDKAIVITVFGSINLDLIGSVDRLPRPGETVLGGAFHTAPGGKGANQALAANRAGAAVRMIGAVGRDGHAEAALSLLREGNVDLSGVKPTEKPTGVALILVNRVGENVIAVMPGANGEVTSADASKLNPGAGEVLLLQLEVPVDAIVSAARRARTGGALVILNFAPFREDALPLADVVTHLVLNETECELLAGALGVPGGDMEARARALSERTGATVVVTLGKAGAIAIESGRSLSVPALSVDPVDTVGAGDTFCGYFAAALGEGKPLADALRLAAGAGSLACTKPGAQPSIPLRRDVEAAIGVSA